MKFLWITDPWETLDHPRDTTLRLIEESLALGHESRWCDSRTIRWERSSVVLDARQVETVYPGRAEKAFHLKPAEPIAPEEFESIHYRVDPPVDLAYLQPLQLLVLGLGGPEGLKKQKHVEVVNPPEVLMMGSEKLEGSFLHGLMPPTVASSRKDALAAFGKAEGRAVLKPLHEAQSKGIELLDWRTSDAAERAAASIDRATEQGRRPVILQRYLEAVAEGEQRLWFIDGELLAFARKCPKPGEFKIDMDRGGTLQLSELTAKEKKAAQLIGKHLSTKRIRLAAVDLIEGLVTDFNFTSPGLLVGMESLLGENLARPIIERLAKK